MKILLLIFIRLYWLLIPESGRRRCLFKTSCSNYVYDRAKSEGLISGLKALKFRIKNCNPNYSITTINEEKILVSAVQQVFKEDEINPSILK